MMKQFTFNNQRLDFSIDDFSKWVFSDLVSNVTRSILAEFIVAKALGIEHAARVDWNAYDLEYKGVKIEVKSSAYIQTWNKDKYAKPRFSIGQKKGWYADTNTVGELKRHADVYVFCLLAHKDWATIDPLNLDQWEFYIVSTKNLNEKLPLQKNIGLTSLIKKFNLSPVRFDEIKKRFSQFLQ